MLEKSCIDKACAVRIESEIARRNIKLSAGIIERYGPCPVCGGRDRFSINIRKQVWNCRGCTTGGDVIDLVRHIDGSDFKEAVATLAGHAPSQKPPLSAQSKSLGYMGSADPKKAVSYNHKRAMVIWAEARDPRGSFVESYLLGRRLELPYEAANEAIRFHPDCPFGSERFPAMVCLVRNIKTNDPQAIHRTALMPDGTAVKRNGKTFRLSLGPIAGGGIKLDPDEDVTQGLYIGEGVETCLASRQMELQPVWACLGTSGVATFPVLPGVEGLYIFRERDANGASPKAVEICARRWYEAGRDVLIVEPDVGNDLNDELREAVR